MKHTLAAACMILKSTYQETLSRTAVVALLLVAAVGCSAPVNVGKPSTQRELPAVVNELDTLVKEIVVRAKKGDAAYFAPLMDPRYRGQETNLVVWIQRSGMATNYVDRCTFTTNGMGRLNYHFLERGCHYQFDLYKTNETWTIKRIWLCR